MTGVTDSKSFRAYHTEKVIIDEEVRNEIFIEKEEYRYEELSAVKEKEIACTVKMRNEIKKYSKLPFHQKQEFAQVIRDSTTTLSIREMSKIAMVGRNRLWKKVPPGPS